MPARAYHLTIRNRTELALGLREAHLCSGEWVSDEWRPTGIIGPGGQGEMKSGSDGFLGGTSGWAQYQLGDLGAILHLYWDNPYVIGTTHSQARIAAPDVPVECDEHANPAASLATDLDAVASFEATLHSVGDGDGVQTVIDLAQTAFSAGGWLALYAHIRPDASDVIDVVDRQVESQPEPEFQDLTRTAVRLEDPTYRDWAHRFRSADRRVDITVTHQMAALRAVITDTATDPPYFFEGQVANTFDDLARWVTEQDDATPILIDAVNVALGLDGPRPTVLAVVEQLAAANPLIRSERTPAATAVQLARGAKGALRVDDRTTLQLYAVTRDGQRAGLQALYQRFDEHGSPVAQVVCPQLTDVL